MVDGSVNEQTNAESGTDKRWMLLELEEREGETLYIHEISSARTAWIAG
jgi:hypothetical protein